MVRGKYKLLGKEQAWLQVREMVRTTVKAQGTAQLPEPVKELRASRAEVWAS